MENQKGKNPKERPTLEKGVPEGRRRNFFHSMIYQGKSPKERPPWEKGYPKGGG